MADEKAKLDLLNTLGHIERYHRRRMIFTGHLVLSLGIQFAMWANWVASYAVNDMGFSGTYFADRFIISVVLALFLAGHFVTMRLMETKDRLVVKSIQSYNAADEFIGR